MRTRRSAGWRLSFAPNLAVIACLFLLNDNNLFMYSGNLGSLPTGQKEARILTSARARARTHANHRFLPKWTELNI